MDTEKTGEMPKNGTDGTLRDFVEDYLLHNERPPDWVFDEGSWQHGSSWYEAVMAVRERCGIGAIGIELLGRFYIPYRQLALIALLREEPNSPYYNKAIEVLKDSSLEEVRRAYQGLLFCYEEKSADLALLPHILNKLYEPYSLKDKILRMINNDAFTSLVEDSEKDAQELVKGIVMIRPQEYQNIWEIPYKGWGVVPGCYDTGNENDPDHVAIYLRHNHKPKIEELLLSSWMPGSVPYDNAMKMLEELKKSSWVGALVEKLVMRFYNPPLQLALVTFVREAYASERYEEATKALLAAPEEAVIRACQGLFYCYMFKRSGRHSYYNEYKWKLVPLLPHFLSALYGEQKQVKEPKFYKQQELFIETFCNMLNDFAFANLIALSKRDARDGMVEIRKIVKKLKKCTTKTP